MAQVIPRLKSHCPQGRTHFSWSLHRPAIWSCLVVNTAMARGAAAITLSPWSRGLTSTGVEAKVLKLPAVLAMFGLPSRRPAAAAREAGPFLQRRVARLECIIMSHPWGHPRRATPETQSAAGGKATRLHRPPTRRSPVIFVLLGFQRAGARPQRMRLPAMCLRGICFMTSWQK